MKHERIRPMLAVLAAIWGSVGICTAQPPEDVSAWQFPKAGDLVFPKAIDLQFPQPKDLAGKRQTCKFTSLEHVS